MKLGRLYSQHESSVGWKHQIREPRNHLRVHSFQDGLKSFVKQEERNVRHPGACRIIFQNTACFSSLIALLFRSDIMTLGAPNTKRILFKQSSANT